MATHRLKQSFSSGELSPLMDSRVDFKRYTSGCNVLKNMVCSTQGPASSRSGNEFIYDLNDLGIDVLNPLVRKVPFVFNELQAYDMIFFMHTDGFPRLVFGYRGGLLVYGNPPPDYCPPTYIHEEDGAGQDDFIVEGVVITADTDVTVTQVDNATGNETVLTLGVDYDIIIDTPVGGFTVDMHIPVANPDFMRVYLNGKGVAGEIVTLTLPETWDIKKFDYAQSADELYCSQSILQPHVIRRHGHECWELVRLTFTDQPTDWSDEFGWPEKVTFHQQRLAFAATTLRRQTVWMSRAGDFTHFGQESPIVDSDAITFTLDSGTQNKIQWMISGKTLNIGTLGNEWVISGATRNALTPTNVLSQRQTNHGSEPNKPIMVGITVLFVERHGKVINEFVYNLNVDSYETSDIAILSPHITEHFSVIDWAYQQTPDSVIWSIREDGRLIGVTYQRQHEVIGWHTHDTVGEFKALAVIPGINRSDELWTIVNRVIEGEDHYFVERMAPKFISEDTIDGRFLDSYLVYDGPPATTLSGLDHLEGELVGIMADGTAHPDQIVVAGSITLNKEYSHAVIGKKFEAEIWPTINDVSDPEGTTLGRMQRITDVDIDLYRTLGMTIGRFDSEDGEVEEDVPFRVPGDLTGTRVPLFTGIVHLAFPEGFDRQAAYFIKQKQPFPLTVRSVVDVFEYTK